MMSRFITVTFILCIFFFLPFHAVGEITHGGEIEFTNDWINEIDSPEKRGVLRGREYPAAEHMARIVQEKCRSLKCRVQRVQGKWGVEWRVTLQKGWWFQISYDPLCVEIQTRPSTLAELYRVQNDAEKLIFDSAFEAGLKVNPNRATHMNTGVRSAFGYDVKKLFNYFVDHANHPEFSSGIFRNNWNTAPPLVALGVDPSDAIKTIQKMIETNQIRSFSQLAFEVAQRLHHIHPKPEQYLTEKNQDLNFFKLKSLNATNKHTFFQMPDVPMEDRGTRAVKTFLEFILHAELIEHRISWVNQHQDFIPFQYKTPKEVQPSQRDKIFKNWLDQMGLSFERYHSLIPPTDERTQGNSRNQCQHFYVQSR